MHKAPWDDMKIAFGCDAIERLWAASDAGKLVLPDGWHLIETDCSGARCVAIFRVEGVPTVEAGQTVAAIVQRYGRA